MNTCNPVNLSFRSTIIPRNANKSFNAYMDTLKSCELKSMSNSSVENCYKELFREARELKKYRTGVMMDRQKDVLMRFMGYSPENDQYIFNQLKKVDKNVRYIKDVPNDGYEHNTIELLI